VTAVLSICGQISYSELPETGGNEEDSPVAPFLGKRRYEADSFRFLSGLVPRQTMNMNTATSFPWPAESAEKGLDVLFEHAPVGIAKCSHLGTITAVNPAFEQILGGPLPPAAALRDLIGPGENGDTDRLLKDLVSGDRPNFRVERAVPGSRAGDCSLQWTAWRVDEAKGQPAFGLVMAEQPGVDRNAERRLRQAQKFESVGRMAGGIAHDFNNLVTGVLLYSDLLLAEMDQGTRLRGYVEEIRAAGIQAAEVVRQLLAAARPQDSSPQPISLNAVIEGMRDLLVRMIGASGSLYFHLDANLGFVRMLTTQVQQILLNLVLNARDAIADGGRIAIETSNCRVQIVTDTAEESDETHLNETTPATLPCAVFSVRDNGIGMDAETQERLFEAFFTTKAPGKGTGLGLTTVHDLVSASGGLIYVDSAPGRGTRVTILLPLVPEFNTSSHTPTATVGHEGAPLQPEKEIIP
jgi:two-component system cell cycle sensor histidine kinase/response regulator CckA